MLNQTISFLNPQSNTLTNAARNPTNDDIITSTFVHVLSAFAIAEAQQDIFLRIKSYLVLNGFELPRLNGIYNSSDFMAVRQVKTSYLHILFSQALQTAVHANWIAMAHSILIHCKEMRIQVSVSKMDLSVLLSNATYELMNLLIEYGAYFDRNERSIVAEKMLFKQVPKQPGENTDSEEELNKEVEQKWKNLTGFQKATDLKSLASEVGGSSPFKHRDDYSKVMSNLD